MDGDQDPTDLLERHIRRLEARVRRAEAPQRIVAFTPGVVPWSLAEPASL